LLRNFVKRLPARASQWQAGSGGAGAGGFAAFKYQISRKKIFSHFPFDSVRERVSFTEFPFFPYREPHASHVAALPTK